MISQAATDSYSKGFIIGSLTTLSMLLIGIIIATLIDNIPNELLRTVTFAIFGLSLIFWIMPLYRKLEKIIKTQFEKNNPVKELD